MCFVRPRRCLGASWILGLWAGGRGLTLQRRLHPPASPLIKGCQVVRSGRQGPLGPLGPGSWELGTNVS